ncbi:MAG: glycosyltransferase [Halanaeroarchaeum sp.]
MTATRLNDAAISLLRELDDETFRSPARVAAATDHDLESVDHLFERLAQRDFLEWRPMCDPDHTPPVSVVITVRNDRDHLERCLDSLSKLAYPEYEVLVVDDGSTDGTKELVESQETTGYSTRLVSVGDADDPIGIGASRNRGVEAATYDTIAFTDADCQPRSEWLVDLTPCLAVADLVGGRVRPAGESAASVYEGLNSSLDMGAYASRVDPAGDTPYLATANLVGRRDVFEEIPFPERNVAEDVEVCWDALDAGYDVVYTPTGVVEHDYRDEPLAFATRRAVYGASEVLLASTHDRDDSRVGIPGIALLVAGLGVIGVISSGMVAMGALALVVAVLGLTAGLHGWRGWRRSRRLAPVISSTDLVESWGRRQLSTAYALSREVTRYYALPIALLAGVCLAVGPRWIGAGGMVTLAIVVALPAVVEYSIHEPSTSRTCFAAYYLADHLGYQVGVYRGGVAHGTVEHLRPDARFRIA